MQKVRVDERCTPEEEVLLLEASGPTEARSGKEAITLAEAMVCFVCGASVHERIPSLKAIPHFREEK